MDAPTSLPHLTRIADLDDRAILDLFEKADAIRDSHGRDAHATGVSATNTRATSTHSGRIVAMLFYEPSTRTRLSFESAALRLGANVIGFSDPKIASVAKGESLIDTIRTVQRYCDAIVIRHPSEGAAMLASKVAMVPIINAGDGGHEHPTQTLFDLYTIHQRFGSLEGRVIGMTGDLLYGRTVHSLAKAAARFGAKLICISPPELQLPAHLRDRLSKQTDMRLANEIEDVVSELDVLYVTRVQMERIPEQQRERIGSIKPFTRDRLGHAKSELLIMHPLPRVDEIGYDVDEDARAWYFEQLANGVVMRMAILDRVFSQTKPNVLGAMDKPQMYADAPWTEVAGGAGQCSNAKCVTNTEHSITPRSEDGEHCAYCDQPL